MQLWPMQLWPITADGAQSLGGGAVPAADGGEAGVRVDLGRVI